MCSRAQLNTQTEKKIGAISFVFNFYFNKSKTIPKIKHTKQVKGDAAFGLWPEQGRAIGSAGIVGQEVYC